MKYFFYQDYPNKELIIVDDSPVPYPHARDLPANIYYKHLPYRRYIGTKRNIACEIAVGEIIASLDDDDWFSPTYLSQMVAPLISGEADLSICSVQGMYVLDIPTWQRWRHKDDGRLARFAHDATLCFKREWWERGYHYPDHNDAEGTAMMQHMRLDGARQAIVESGDSFVYVRHGGNTWSFTAGRFLQEDVWETVERDWPISQEDMQFYEEMRT